jgi:ABC-type polar amino acid transport system ATPase subunit
VGEVLNVMKGLAAEGMTMIVVTPRDGLCREVADRVVFFDGGKIVEMGRLRRSSPRLSTRVPGSFCKVCCTETERVCF